MTEQLAALFEEQTARKRGPKRQRATGLVA